MSISVNIHGTTKIHAEADHSVDSKGQAHWVRLRIVNHDSDFHTCLFFDNADLADRYAAAINGVRLAADEIEDASEPALQIERARQ